MRKEVKNKEQQDGVNYNGSLTLNIAKKETIMAEYLLSILKIITDSCQDNVLPLELLSKWCQLY